MQTVIKKHLKSKFIHAFCLLRHNCNTPGDDAWELLITDHPSGKAGYVAYFGDEESTLLAFEGIDKMVNEPGSQFKDISRVLEIAVVASRPNYVGIGHNR